MAGSDPRKTRPFGQGPQPGAFDAEEDPLVELARIVSEDGAFSSPRNERPKPRREEPLDRNALSGDLEAELMQELETSFPKRPAPPARPAPAARPTPAPRAARPAPAEPRPAPAAQPPREQRAAPIVSAPREPRAPIGEAPPVRAQRAAPPAEPAPQMQRPRPAAATPAPVPVAAAPEESGDIADDLLRSIEEQLGQFERRVRAERDAPSLDDDEPAREESIPARVQASAPEPEEEPEAPEELDEPEPHLEAAPVEPVRSEYRFRGPAVAPWAEEEASDDDLSDADDRADDLHALRQEPLAREMEPPAPAAEEPEPLPFDPPVRRSARPQVQPRLDEVEFEEPKPRAARPEPRPSRPREEEDDDDRLGAPKSALTPAELFRREARAGFVEFEAGESPKPAARERDLSGVEAALESEFAMDDPEPPRAGRRAEEDDEDDDGDARAAIPPAAVASAAMRSGKRPPPPRSRGRLGSLLYTLGGIVLVVLIGGAAAMYLRSGPTSTSSAPPPVIAAPSGPVKEQAAGDQAQSESQTVGEAVYDRVAGRKPDSQEQVVDNSEEPREVARIVLPQSQESDDAMVRPVGGDASGDTGTGDMASDAGTASDQPAQTAAAADGPRRVPTFVVKPDGTIVSTGEAGATPAPPTESMAAAAEPSIEPVPVKTVAIGGTSQTAAGNAASAVAAAPPMPKPAAGGSSGTMESAASAADDATSADDASGAEMAAAEPTPAPKRSGAPVDLLGGGTGTAMAVTTPAPSASGSDGYVVQISSQRSRDAAEQSYANQKRRFPQILGSLALSIQEADVGGKGTYYRARVGPWATRDEAIQVCEQLKAAGGDCLVTK